MSELPEPPEFLTEEARACFLRVRARLLAMGEWRPEYALGLGPCAMGAAAYLRDARAIRGMKDVEPALLKELEDGLERTRQLVRGFLADFLMMPRERVALAVMNAEGLDADLVGLCRP
jgi:hypothetical protein